MKEKLEEKNQALTLALVDGSVKNGLRKVGNHVALIAEKEEWSVDHPREWPQSHHKLGMKCHQKKNKRIIDWILEYFFPRSHHIDDVVCNDNDNNKDNDDNDNDDDDDDDDNNDDDNGDDDNNNIS